MLPENRGGVTREHHIDINSTSKEKEKNSLSDQSDGQDSPKGESPPKQAKAKDPMYDVILAVFNAHGALNGLIRVLLTGDCKNKKHESSEWYRCRLETPVSAEEITQFAEWYKKTCKGMSTPRKPETIQSWFLQFRATQKQPEKYSAEYYAQGDYLTWKEKNNKYTPEYYEQGSLENYLKRREGLQS